MKLQKLSAALLVAGLTAFGSAYAVPTITLNPSASNGGTGLCDALQIDCAGGNGQAGAYVVSSIQTSLASFLNISSTAGAASWTETGALIFNTYNGGNQRNGGRGLGSGGDYDIYGLFSGAGGGFWTGNQFNVTTIGFFTIDLYASPELGSSITQVTGGVTQGSKDFILGTATFSGSFGGTNAQLSLTDNTATTQLTAEFTFAPASPAYTALGGFFQAPDPFNVSFNGSGSSNSGQSTYASDGSGGVIITSGNGATGNLTPLNKVPEPGSLALVSVALLGAGMAARRKSANKA